MDVVNDDGGTSMVDSRGGVDIAINYFAQTVYLYDHCNSIFMQKPIQINLESVYNITNSLLTEQYADPFSLETIKFVVDAESRLGDGGGAEERRGRGLRGSLEEFVYSAPTYNSTINTLYSRTFANYFEYMNIVEYGPMIMNYFTLAFGATGTDDIVCFIEGMRGQGRTKPQVPL